MSSRIFQNCSEKLVPEGIIFKYMVFGHQEMDTTLLGTSSVWTPNYTFESENKQKWTPFWSSKAL